MTTQATSNVVTGRKNRCHPPTKDPIEDVESRFADDSFDVVFIDGDHRYEAVVRDLCIARRVVTPGGVIAVHDYGNRAGVTQAVDELKLPFKQVETLVILENV